MHYVRDNALLTKRSHGKHAKVELLDLVLSRYNGNNRP